MFSLCIRAESLSGRSRARSLPSCFLTSRRSQPPLALSVPLSRFTSRVGGGSAFFVRLGELCSLASVHADFVVVVFNFRILSPRGQIVDQPMMLIRASFLLVVSDLKPVLRRGGRGAGLVAKPTRLVIDGMSVLVIGIGLGLQFSKPHDNHVNANREFS